MAPAAATATATATATESTITGSYSYADPGVSQGQVPSSSFQYQPARPRDQQPLPGGPEGPITMRSNDGTRSSAPMPMPGPSRGYDRDRDRDHWQSQRSRRGSPSSSDALSLSSSSSSSSYLDISRWYPSYGRSGGVLNAFFKTPSERRQRARRRRSLKKKNRGIFPFGNNSSSSSVNSDMAYGMGFVKKPKSRNFSPRRRERAATLEKLEGRPSQVGRRQTDEEILELGRKLAKVARDSNREDLRAMGGKRPSSQLAAAQDTWDRYSRQTATGLAAGGLAAGYAASSRGIAPTKHARHSSSSSDDEWESASEGEYTSDESNSGLAYGTAVEFGRPSPPPKSSVSRHSTVLSARPPEDIRPPDRKSSAVDPRLFGPVNSLRGLINTPCGYGDRNSVYTIPGPAEQRYAGSSGTAESASIEARPLQTVYPVQTSDPSRVDAARASGSFVSSQPSFSALSREPPHSSRRPDPIPIQAPKPIAPVPTSMYDEQRIRDSEQTSPRESRIRPSENKTFAETALVGAGVAALGAAIMASRDKGKGKEKERDLELRHGRHEKYGHDDYRETETIVQDSRRAKELALEKEIERLERALADRNKAREQRKRDSRRDTAISEPSGSREADVDTERDYEKRRRDRDSRYSEPDYNYGRPEASRRVSEHGERPAAADSDQVRRAELPAAPPSSGVDVFQFQVPDDAFRTRDSPLRAASPVIIDVTPAPSPPLEQADRKSRPESFVNELRDAKHIYEESMHSTAPIPAVDMAAAIGATERAQHRDQPERGRTLTKTQDIVQENANAYYHARRMAERDVSSRSRSKSDERSVVEKYDKDRNNESHGSEIVRIVTPPEMMQKPQKHKYSEPNADFRFDNLMSPKDLDHFRPQEYLVRDPSAERPRPLLNLVIPTPVPTPTPEIQKNKTASSGSPEKVVKEPVKEDIPYVTTSPRGEVVEPPQTPSSKRVSWGPSETQQYEVDSPERSQERRSRSYERESSPSRSSGWAATAAAVAGVAAATALSKDNEPERSSPGHRARDSTGSKSSEGSGSPPGRKLLPKGTAPSRVLDDEPEDVPPAPGPKPASPRRSQMPGAFADDLDFAATLAAGLQDTGFDPNIVIEDATYRRRDSPPGSNEHTGVYMQPYSETVTDLGVIDFEDGSRPKRESGYVIDELVDTPASEKGSAFDTAENSSRRQSRSEKTRSIGSDSIEVIHEPEQESPKLTKKEKRRLEKAARSTKIAEEEDRASQPAEAGGEDWEGASTARKSKRSSKKQKRTSVAWDDADTPVNDKRVSVPVDAFGDIDDTKLGDAAWEEPQRTSKSKRDSKGYDMAEDPSDRRERRREERRRSELYEPLDRDVSSAVSDSRHDDRSNGRGRHEYDDERSVVSAPDGKRDSKEEKRSSGGFWGLLKGSNGVDSENQSKKDNAGTLGAGAGVAEAVAVASHTAGSLASRSDAAEAAPAEENQHVIVDLEHPSEQREVSPSRGIDVFDFQDPEITPRVIKPAIDPQYGDLLPLPPSPSDEQRLDFIVSDDLPSLPDSRPATPPGQEKLLPREKGENSQKRPGFATHSRRRSAYDMPLKSPSHTAIPIAFRMGQRSSNPASPRVVSNPTSAHQSPSAASNDTFSPSAKRSPRPPSWDRPTSWESTREIKPLYLIERSAHADPDAGAQARDDRAENTPLPPSRDSDSPAPECEVSGDNDTNAPALESAPLFVDTAAARAAPLESQEPTPKGLTHNDSALPGSAREFDSVQTDMGVPSYVDSSLPHSAKDFDTLFMAKPHQSPLPESSYATPTGSPSLGAQSQPQVQRDESTESVSDFQDALDRPALVEDVDSGRSQDISSSGEEAQHSSNAETPSVHKQDKPSRFSSALSMLPAAGLAGVGALLARGSSHDKTAGADGPIQDIQESTAKSSDRPSKADVVPEPAGVQPVTLATSGLGGQTQAPPTAYDSKLDPATLLDATGNPDVLLPDGPPAAPILPEEVRPISDLQLANDAPRDVGEPEPEHEAVVMDGTDATCPPPPTQASGNDTSSSPVQSPKDMETIPETPLDTAEWPEKSKSKGEKGKKKRNSVGTASIPATVEPSRTFLDIQQNTTVQEVPVSKAIEEPSSLPHAAAALSVETSQEVTGPGTEQSQNENILQGAEADIAPSPQQLLGGNGGTGLTDDPEVSPGSDEVSISRDAIRHSRSQDYEPQVGGHSRRSSSDGGRLRSSRRTLSPRNIAGRDGSPDIFYSGDDAPASARSSTGQKYNTRCLRSSQRLSLASHGTGRGNDFGPSESLAFDQHGDDSDEHKEAHDVEKLAPVQHERVEKGAESPLDVAEQQVSTPFDVVDQGSSAQTGFHDEPEVEVVGVVDKSASAQPQLSSAEAQRIGRPATEDPRGTESTEGYLQDSTPIIAENTSPILPLRTKEESRGGLAAEPLDHTPGVSGLHSLQDTLGAGNEALSLPSEILLRENPQDELPKDISSEKALVTEPDHAVHDGLEHGIGSPPPISAVQQADEPASRSTVDESSRHMPGLPPREIQQYTEPVQSSTQEVPESETQGEKPVLASAEDDNSFSVEKPKKDKIKRKSSTLDSDTIPSFDTAIQAELDSSIEPGESSFELPTDRQDEFGLPESSSLVKATPSEGGQLPGNAESTNLPMLSETRDPEGFDSRLTKATTPVSKDKSPVESLHIAGPTVLPVLHETSAEIPISELLDEDEVARREAEADLVRDEEAEMSRLLSKKKLKPKEKTRLRQLRGNADRRAEEAAAVAETMPQQDVSEGQRPSSPAQQIVVEEETTPVTKEPILTTDATAGSSSLVKESSPSRVIDESQEAIPLSSDVIIPSEHISSQSIGIPGTSSTTGETYQQPNEYTQQVELQPRAEVVEDAEDLARREAESALIRDEEAELSRLEYKKKLNKKDKARLKVLRSRAEQRAQEAESDTQANIEQQDAAGLETPVPEANAGSSSQLQEEDSIRDRASQGSREMSIGDPQSSEGMIQVMAKISASPGSHADDVSNSLEGDLGAKDVRNSSEIQPQAQELSQPQVATSPNEATISSGPLRLEESLPEQSDQHAKRGSTQGDSAQIPQILIEDTTSQLDPLPDERRAVDILQSESKLDSPPHVEGSVPGHLKAQAVGSTFDMPGAQGDSPSQARDAEPTSEAQDDVATAIHPEQYNHAPAAEPILVSDMPETELATDTSHTFGEPEQPAVTVTELPQDAESEWAVTTKKSKKSKKDKNKKRKGTISESSGQDSGTVTPFFDASERSPVIESQSLSETVDGGDMPQPSSFKPDVIEQGQQPTSNPPLDDNTARDSRMEETMAEQPVEASISDQQGMSLRIGKSILARGVSDGNNVRDLVERTTADLLLESTILEPPQADSEQVTLDKERAFEIVSKESKTEKKKSKNTISEDVSLVSGSATPIVREEMEQSPSLPGIPASLEDEQVTAERSPMPLDFAKEPAAMPSTADEYLGTESPVLEREQYLPHSVIGEQLSTSNTLEEIPTSLPQPEQLTQVETSLSECVAPVTLPSEPLVVQDTDTESTHKPSSPLVQPSKLERIATDDLRGAPPMPTQYKEEHSPGQLPETEGLHSTSLLESESKQPHVEPDTAGRPARKSDGWGFLAGAIAGAGVATMRPNSREKSPGRDPPSEDIVAGQSPIQTVSTDTIAPRTSLSFVNVIETASAPSPRDQEHSQANESSQDQCQSASFGDGDRVQSDDIPQDPKPIQEDTSDVLTIAPEESQDQGPSSRSLDVVDTASSRTQISPEEDTKQEQVLTSNDFNQNPDNFMEVAADLQSSLPEGQVTPLEPQPQIDEWAPTSSSKEKKKDKKRKNSSTSWRQPESGAQTPVEESSEARDVSLDTNERSTGLDAADLVRPRDNLAKQSEPGTDFGATEGATEERDVPSLGESVFFEGVSQPEATEIARDTLASSDLHRFGGDGDTTVAVASQAFDDLGPGQIQNDDRISSPGIGPSRSLEPESESSATVHQITAESADAPVEQDVEPQAEDLWGSTPRKLSKKEKRKAKKGSLSTNAPGLPTAAPEDSNEQISEDPTPDLRDTSPQQEWPVLGKGGETLVQDVDKIDFDLSVEPDSEPPSTQPLEEAPSQAQEIPVQDTPVLPRKMSKKEKRKAKKASLSSWEDGIAEPVQPSQSQVPIVVEPQVQDIPTVTSPTVVPELEQKEATQESVSIDEPQSEQLFSGDTGPSIAMDATAEEEWAAPISRKKSKKEKKKKGKQSSSGSISGTQTPAAVLEAPALQSMEDIKSDEPLPEHYGASVVPTENVGGSEDGHDLRHSEAITLVPDNNASEERLSVRALEDASASEGRKDHRSAELYVPGVQRSLDIGEPTMIEDDWDIPSDDQSKNKNKASSSRNDEPPTLSTPMKGAHRADRYFDEASSKDAESSKLLRSPASRGKELEKMQPSPDLWDDEEYFKPKPANFAESDQEAFTKFDIHPAVARGLNASPDRRVGEDRPLVGLGLIHRHSSIFREDDGHVPKLLTMASDNISTDSVAIQETEEAPWGGSSQLGSLTRSATVPARPDSRSKSHDEGPSPAEYYDQGLSPAVKQVNTKQWFTFETGPAHGANVPLARSVSPDNLRSLSPGLPRSPQLSPQLSPSPRSPQFPPPQGPPRSSQYSPRNSSSFEAARDPSKKGSVAALAQRFGGAKKATGKTQPVPEHVDKHALQEDDLFNEPAMREGAKYMPLQGSRLDVDSGDSWTVPDTNLEEQSDPDMKISGQGAEAASHGREPTTPGSDNVSEPCSQPDIDSGKFTPQIPDQASREAEIPLESVVIESPVESPVLGSQASVDVPTEEQQPRVTWPGESPETGPNLPEIREPTLHDFAPQPHASPEARSRSPDFGEISTFGEPISTIETEDGDARTGEMSVIDFSRSLPRELPPVQEEPHEEEAESGGHIGHILAAKPRAVTPDTNRDSGVVTGSPVPPRLCQFEDAQQQRDSGVHMREPSGTCPRVVGTGVSSPQPPHSSHPPIEEEGSEDTSKRSSASATESETQRRFREATPKLEAHDMPVTPEPRKNTSKSRKYPDLGPSPGKKTAAAALAVGGGGGGGGGVLGGALLAAGTTRSRTPSPSPSPAASQRSVSADDIEELGSSALPKQRRAASSNTGVSRSRTPEPLAIRAESPSMLRHSGTPPLRSRRTRSGDLRSLSQSGINRSASDLGAQASSSPASAVSAAAAKAPAHLPKTNTTPASSDLRRATTPAATAQGTTSAPTANEGRVRSKDMADVYVSYTWLKARSISLTKVAAQDGVGEGRLGSPRSPTRPHSMRRRQSMQVLELESRVEQLVAENRALQDARAQAELHTTNRASSTLAERDTEIEALKQSLDFMRKEVQRLTEVNEGLNSAIQQHAVQHDDRYRLLENQHAEATKELLEHRDRHGSYSQTIQDKDEEIRGLREQLEAAKEQIREMQKQILATKPADSDFLRIKDVDYFDHRCQQLCSHVQQWVLRFSKFSDMRACRLTTELNDEKIIDRLDNAVLDGSNVDHYLNDRVRRRDVFMSVTMTMIWEFVFTRYLFGMDREQRQKLKNLEKLLLEVGPPQAVRQWRAVTLTLLSKREPFKDQRDQDTEAVVQAVFQTLSMILPPPSNLEDQIQGQLRKVMREAVDLSIEMRTQRAEYMMLPPLQPDYDANGDLAEPHPFNSALMNERSGDKNATMDNEALEASGAVVRVVLFPLVVKKGDDNGVGDDEIVVCPAQVIVSRPRSKSRQSYRAPSSDAGGVSLLRGGSPSTGPNRSNVSMTDAPGMAPGMEGAI
jgi:hypothetical protein